MTEPRTLYVCHGMYGCETGCCGYRLCLDPEGVNAVGEFEFGHPNGRTPEAFAREFWPKESDGAVIKKGAWYEC